MKSRFKILLVLVALIFASPAHAQSSSLWKLTNGMTLTPVVSNWTLNIASTTGTSTASNGWNISGGCYAIAGTCIGAGSVSSVNAGVDTLAFSPTTGAVLGNVNLNSSNFIWSQAHTWGVDKKINFGPVSSFNGAAYYDSSPTPDAVRFGVYNVPSAKGDAPNLSIDGANGAAAGVEPRSGTKITLNPGAAANAGTTGYVSINNLAPASFTASQGLLVGDYGEFQSGLAVGSVISSLIKTDSSGIMGPASAGTDYENPLTFNSPLSRSMDTISLPGLTRSTNDYAVTPGTLKVNNDSSTGFVVEQDGVNDDTFVVDTDVGAVAVGATPVSTTLLNLNTTKQGLTRKINITTSETTRVALPVEIAIVKSRDWTGNGATQAMMQVIATDNAVITNTASDATTLINAQLTKNASTTSSAAFHNAFGLTVGDNAAYNRSTGNQQPQFGLNAITYNGNFKHDDSQNGRTLTYTISPVSASVGSLSVNEVNSTSSVSVALKGYQFSDATLNKTGAGSANITGTSYGYYCNQTGTGWADQACFYNAGSSKNLLGNGFTGIGTTTPATPLQVTVSASNATSTLTVGKVGQNKGSCLELFDSAGTAVYAYVPAGGTAFTLSATSCK